MSSTTNSHIYIFFCSSLRMPLTFVFLYAYSFKQCLSYQVYCSNENAKSFLFLAILHLYQLTFVLLPYVNALLVYLQFAQNNA